MEKRRIRVQVAWLVSVAIATSISVTGQQSTPTKPTCFTYDPATLRVAADGATGWRVLAGGEPRWLLDTEADARAALRVASGFRKSCTVPSFSGRVVQFLDDAVPGRSAMAGDDADCLPYIPTEVAVEKEGSQFNLITKTHRLAAFKTASDAAAIMDVAKRATHHCFVGRSNRRPDRPAYIFEYWR